MIINEQKKKNDFCISGIYNIKLDEVFLFLFVIKTLLTSNTFSLICKLMARRK